jgi:hypothetical protein
LQETFISKKDIKNMVCYIVPLIAAVLSFIGRRASHKDGAHAFWLNIMFLGGTLFGVIDHLWHGELFLIGTGWFMDLALGGVITAGITAGWGVIVLKPRIADSLHNLGIFLGILKDN